MDDRDDDPIQDVVDDAARRVRRQQTMTVFAATAVQIVLYVVLAFTATAGVHERFGPTAGKVFLVAITGLLVARTVEFVLRGTHRIDVAAAVGEAVILVPIAAWGLAPVMSWIAVLVVLGLCGAGGVYAAVRADRRVVRLRTLYASHGQEKPTWEV